MKLKLIIFLILLAPIVFSLTECPRFGTIQKNIPCIQPSSWKPEGNCEDYNLTLYNSVGTPILNTTWYSYTPYCAFNITSISELGTYCYNSSIEDGCITLEKEDNMLSIILIQIGLVVFFILVGIPYKMGFAKFLSWGMAVIEIVMTVWIGFLNETGGRIDYLLYINALVTLVLGGLLGFIAVIMLMIKLQTGFGKKLEDDGYTKFVFDTK